MQYSPAFCSAGWLWRQQSLAFELGIWGQAGWRLQSLDAQASFQSFQETCMTSCYLRFPWIVSLNSNGFWGQHLLLVHRKIWPGPAPASVVSVKGDTSTQALDGRKWWANSSDGMFCPWVELPYDELDADFECLYSAVKWLCCCFDWRAS